MTLIRRSSIVVTGLPPSWETIETITHDPRGFRAAYVEYIDTLLRSPRYGERWAQHWLDVIRWAETVGFETNQERRNAWPYRDWVIESLNADMPYNEFVFQQIAGDTVGVDAALGFLAAGPANLPGQIGRDEEAMRQARQDELDEVIRTVSQSLLGLTVGCARCHNHKFDPILQKDYYALQAIFAGMTYGNRRWRGPTNDEWTVKVPSQQVKRDMAQAAVNSFRKEHELRPPIADLQTESFPAVRARAVRMQIHQTHNNSPVSLYEFEAWTAGDESTNVALASGGAKPSASSFALANQTRHFDNLVDGSRDRRQAFPWVAQSTGPAWLQIDFPEPKTIDRVVWDRGNSVPVDFTIETLSTESDQWQVVADSKRRMLRNDDLRKPESISIDGLLEEDIAEIVTLIRNLRGAQNELNRLSAGPQVYGAIFSETPEDTYLLKRGDPMQRGERVQPAIPMVLGKMDFQSSQDSQSSQGEIQRRIAFAKHVTDPDHPLTARVMVNRVWHHVFGQGLVDSPSDFGKMGSEPSHPELLDWLASDFVDNDWSIKRLIRKILLSETFAQSSQPNSHAISIDANSRLLWRFPPRRMTAEAIRDSILFVSGKLNFKMGGRGFSFFQQRGGLSGYTPLDTFDENGWRRMVYAHKIRMQSVDVFGAFDCPDAGQMKPKRTQSITPVQSLGLLNSPFVIRQSEFLAERVKTKSTSQDAKNLVMTAYTIVFGRKPGEDELIQMKKLVTNHGLEQLCRVLLNTSEFVYLR